MFIEDGQGGGFTVGATEQNQLKTQTENHELQHHNSVEHGRVYQVIGDVPVTGGTQTVLHMSNDSVNRLAMTFIRLQAPSLAGGTAPPNSGTYYQFGFGTTYVSAGSTVTPVNVNRTSSKVADVTTKDNNPTVTGTFLEVDRWYPDDGNMQTFNKQGSIILGQNDTFEIRITTDNLSGIAYSRSTFMYIE